MEKESSMSSNTLIACALDAQIGNLTRWGNQFKHIFGLSQIHVFLFFNTYLRDREKILGGY